MESYLDNKNMMKWFVVFLLEKYEGVRGYDDSCKEYFILLLIQLIACSCDYGVDGFF